MTKVLVVAAHPDDMELGAGATIAKHIQDGDTVEVLILSRGGLSRDGTDLNLVKQVVSNMFEAAKLLGTLTEILNFPDQQFDTVPQLEINKAIEKKIAEVKPDTVYTHSNKDLNNDHLITHKATLTACRPGSLIIKNIYCFEVPSSTEWGAEEFHPQRFVDITDTLPLKLAALECYKTEMREYPHPRSIKGVEELAKLRGKKHGLYAAESFEILRELDLCYNGENKR